MKSKTSLWKIGKVCEKRQVSEKIGQVCEKRQVSEKIIQVCEK